MDRALAFHTNRIWVFFKSDGDVKTMSERTAQQKELSRIEE
jgi:hypothetical protein